MKREIKRALCDVVSRCGASATMERLSRHSALRVRLRSGEEFTYPVAHDLRGRGLSNTLSYLRREIARRSS